VTNVQDYQSPKILLTGHTGQVGSELLPLLKEMGTVWAPDRKNFDLSEPEMLREKIQHFQPALIVNPAAYTSVDAAETDENQAYQINEFAPRILAEEAQRLNIPLIHFSTDYVFDGEKKGAYSEIDKTNPVNIYGLSKRGGEQEIQNIHDKHLIIRTAWVYHKNHGRNFYRTMCKLLKTKNEINVVDDEIGNPTSAPFLAKKVYNIISQLDLNDDREDRWGMYHLVENNVMSRYQFAKKILSEIKTEGDKLDCQINSISSCDYNHLANRPLNSVLNTEKINHFFSLNG
jgi:dTDP-4-dehydrorhamnose reductase